MVDESQPEQPQAQSWLAALGNLPPSKNFQFSCGTVLMSQWQATSAGEAWTEPCLSSCHSTDKASGHYQNALHGTNSFALFNTKTRLPLSAGRAPTDPARRAVNLPPSGPSGASSMGQMLQFCGPGHPSTVDPCVLGTMLPT